MRISVVVPTWRRPDALERCLQGLADQDRRADEVIVVVRETDEETEKLLERNLTGTLNLSVAKVTNPGLRAALNRGLDAVSGDAVAFTDDDTVPRRDWLARIETRFAGDSQLGGLGGRDWLHPASSEAAQSTVGVLRWYGRLVGNHHLGIGGARGVDLLKGANMSFRRDALNGLQVDERLRGAGAEVHTEIDLCFAVRHRGWKLVYDPEVSVDHYPAERLGDDSRSGPVSGVTLEHVTHNETYLLMKWLPWWRRASALLYWSVVGTRHAPGLLLLWERLVREPDRKAAWDRYRATIRGRRSGVRTFIGVCRERLGKGTDRVRDLR